MLETEDRDVVEGVPEPVRLLAQDGAATENSRYHAELEPERHVRMLTEMIVTRRLDDEFVNLQRQGQLALFPPCRGQEAAQVGTTSALRPSDWLFPQYRELGAFVVRGIDPVGVAEMWRGNCHGGVGFVERCCAPISIPIGTHALHAVGLAMGAQRDGDGGVAVAFIGDGATSEGDVHEALNMAAVFDAPCIFVVQNNQWAISVPYTAQTKSASIAHKAVAYGMPGVRCDGNDVLACFAVMSAAVDRARNGGGPTLIEAVTYRMGAHTTSDDPTRYRAEAEVAAWAAADPIERYRRFLEREGIWTATAADAATGAADAAASHLRAGIYDAPSPDPRTIFDHVLSNPTPALVAQREELERELAEELD